MYTNGDWIRTLCSGRYRQENDRQPLRRPTVPSEATPATRHRAPSAGAPQVHWYRKRSRLPRVTIGLPDATPPTVGWISSSYSVAPFNVSHTSSAWLMVGIGGNTSPSSGSSCAGARSWNRAETLWSRVMPNEQPPEPAQSPPQPAKTKSVLGRADRFTLRPES